MAVDIVQPDLPAIDSGQVSQDVYNGPALGLERGVDAALPHQKALTAVPLALQWLGSAQRGTFGALNAAISGSEGDRRRAGVLLRRHFKLEGGDFTAPSSVLLALRRYYAWMYYVLNRAVLVHNRGDRDQVFVHDEAGAEAGEPAFIPVRRDGAIHFADFYLQLGPRNQALVLLHEASHYVSLSVQDYVYRRISPERYDGLTREYALKNAASFAYFAFHAGTGQDRVIPQAE